MEYRNGTCGSCNATYKIPASFTHDRARCKECGGTVEIGPPTSDDGAAVPALEPYVPSGKKRPGPSMKERLLAQREASGKAPAKRAHKPEPALDDLDDLGDLGLGDVADVDDTPEPAKKTVARKAGATARTPRTPRTGASNRPARGGRRAKTATSDDASDDDSEDAGATTSRRGGRGGRAGGRRGGKRAERSGGKKKANTPMILGLVGLVVLVGAAAFLFREDLGFGGADPVDAADKIETPPSTPADDEANEFDSDAEAPAEVAADDDPLAATAPDAADTEEEAPPPAKAASRDPDSVDLASIADFAAVDGATAEEWAEIEDSVAKAMDPGIGIAQTRAQKALEELGRKAFPAILNHMKGLDLSTEEGTKQGNWCQRMLENICSGTNYGWKEYLEEAEKNGDTYFHWFNKKVVLSWCKAWSQAENNLEAWKNLAKLTDADLQKLKASLGDDAPAPSSVDLLNDD
jgi:hypothetical protein